MWSLIVRENYAGHHQEICDPNSCRANLSKKQMWFDAETKKKWPRKRRDPRHDYNVWRRVVASSVPGVAALCATILVMFVTTGHIARIK